MACCDGTLHCHLRFRLSREVGKVEPTLTIGVMVLDGEVGLEMTY
jgi:hypothetical protein